MRRLACLLFLLTLAAPASAKEMLRAEVCGSDRCVRIAGGDDLWPQAMVDAPADTGGGFVWLKYVMRPSEGTHELPLVDGAVRNDDGGWMALSPSGAARAERAARRVDPLPADALHLEGAAPAATTAPAPPPDDGVSPVPFVAAGVLALLAAAALTVRRRVAA